MSFQAHSRTQKNPYLLTINIDEDATPSGASPMYMMVTVFWFDDFKKQILTLYFYKWQLSSEYVTYAETPKQLL